MDDTKIDDTPAGRKNIASGLRVWLHPPMRGPPRAVMSAMNRCRMQIVYSGQVQGVGFRYTAKTVAAGFEVVGTVRNLPDGRVELMAEGDRGELEAFRDAIRGAGLAGFVRDERVTWSEAKNEFHGFEIVR
ncbi:MAG: acylphosphatase [Limisphaerales bacterium]